MAGATFSTGLVVAGGLEAGVAVRVAVRVVGSGVFGAVAAGAAAFGETACFVGGVVFLAILILSLLYLCAYAACSRTSLLKPIELPGG
jgi:hypothetical protein